MVAIYRRDMVKLHSKILNKMKLCLKYVMIQHKALALQEIETTVIALPQGDKFFYLNLHQRSLDIQGFLYNLMQHKGSILLWIS